MQLVPAVVALAFSPATAVGAGNQQTRQHRSSVQFPERGWQAGQVTISERVVSTASGNTPPVSRSLVTLRFLGSQPEEIYRLRELAFC